MNKPTRDNFIHEFKRYGLKLEKDNLGGRIPINIMLSNSTRDWYTKEKLDADFDRLILNLYAAKKVADEYLIKSKECIHEYGIASYTLQRRVVGYWYVYEHTCKNCFHVEGFQFDAEKRNETILPEWCICAEQRYHNNDI